MNLLQIQLGVQSIRDAKLQLFVSYKETRYRPKYIWILLFNRTDKNYHYLRFPTNKQKLLKSCHLVVPGCVYDINIVGCSTINNVPSASTTVYKVLISGHRHVTVGKNGGQIDIELNSWKLPNARNAIQQYNNEDTYDISVENTPADSCTYTVHDLQCTTDWFNPIQMIWHHQDKTNTYYLTVYRGSELSVTLPTNLIPAMNYTVKVYTANVTHETAVSMELKIDSTSNILSFCAFMRKVELRELLHKAEALVWKNSNMTVEYFYRDKGKNYWDDIVDNYGGIMKKYPKNLSGDPGSVINRNDDFDGLFFNSFVHSKTKEPPPHSVFGTKRLFIPIHTIFNGQRNLYFADIYCHSNHHKIVLVVTKKRSGTDLFCRERLLELNKGCNPFLILTKDGANRMATIPQGVFVEVCYTEDIDIGMLIKNKLAFFNIVQQLGTIKDTSKGIPKRRNCPKCNLEAVING